MSQFGSESTAEDVTEGLSLEGKTFVVTGCNSGIGKETLRVLALRGAHVVGTARTREKAADAFVDVEAEGTPLECELSEPSSVRRCAAALRELGRPLDAIICNAGIMALPERQQKHGIELQLLTNHLGHFLLVAEAAELLADDGRVAVVSSGAHHRAPEVGVDLHDLAAERSYSQWGHYGQSKLANILFAKQLARRWAGTGRTANALHPGVIRTNLGRHDQARIDAMISTMRMKSIAQGAATQVYVATHPDVAGLSGRYFSDCRETEPHPRANDEALAAQLWQRSEEVLARL